jgi:catechol-2,3-dioxygenase
VIRCGMAATVRLAGVSLDTTDPVRLADFYQRLLGLDVYLASDDFVALRGAGILITAQRVPNHVPANWPTGPNVKQMHLELAVDDLDAIERIAIELGASRAVEQPDPDQWRVLIDPAGHPFCITTMIPDDL